MPDTLEPGTETATPDIETPAASWGGGVRLYSDAERAIEADPDHIAMLRSGVGNWNRWRAEYPDVRPNLRGVDFADRETFAGSPIWMEAGALDRQRRRPARCILNGANLAGADCRAASFRNAEMTDLDLRRANLIFCDFENADVWDARIDGADLSGANLKNADFGGVRYDRRRLRGKCLSVREAAGVVGDAVFRRDLLDQEYFDTLDARIRRRTANGIWRVLVTRDAILSSSPILGAMVGLVIVAAFSMLGDSLSPPSATLLVLGLAFTGILLRGPGGQRLKFELWSLFDFGRSWRRVAMFGALSILAFGQLFKLLEPHHLVLTRAYQPANSYAYLDPVQPFLLSAVSFASGGLIGVAEVKTNLGLGVLVLNALFGYAALGLFLSVLSNTFARQGS